MPVTSGPMFDPNEKREIPILMGTQHPDNAAIPFWSDNAFIEAKQETDEVYQNFFTLGCDEYMWDWEGKFADEAMIERLMSKYIKDFKHKQIGRDKFITIRVPNVWEEKTFKLARAYMSVLSAAEFTKSLHLHSPPVFEFILPMATSADQLLHIQDTFRKTAQLHEETFNGNMFGAGYVHMIPIFESVEELAGCGKVLRDYIKGHQERFGKNPAYLRPFIARSDPALNAGFAPAMLATRMGLREMYKVGKEFEIPIYPIVGTGSLPFRGGINPENIENSLPQYEGVKTVTIQSAFKYDYPIQDAKKALNFIKKQLTRVKPVTFGDDEFQTMEVLVEIFKKFYRPTIEEMAPMINKMAKSVPSRRERVQHIGLLGYSRGVGEVSLPRAIKFTAACYSMGIPPEFIGTGRGLKDIKEKGMMGMLDKHFTTLKWELQHAGKFINKENLQWFAQKYDWARKIQQDIELCEEILGIQTGPQKDHHFLHRNLTSNIIVKQGLGMEFEDDLVEAAVMRKSLG